MSRATLAFVLHTHMPYVEGFGTWPFGEEWLWEAVATSYLPLLDLLDEHPGKVTVSVTPVLADQLESMDAMARCLAFLREVRPASHALDLEAEADAGVRAELERSAARYAAAADALERRGDLVAAFAPHAGWTSSATHAVLPLLATDEGVRLQVRAGIDSHRARFGAWDGGFWLPECAHAPWLHHLLEEAGVHAACVDWSAFLPSKREPVRTAEGPLLVPIDREVIELVWSPGGYPSRPAYQDTHRLTERRHRAWAIGGEAYDPAAAAAQCRADAREFVSHVNGRDGLVVCAIDTELLGHWWTEGVDWLRCVFEESSDQGLRLAPLDLALREGEWGAAPASVPVTSWGTGRDLSTWSGPSAGGLAWRARDAELRVLRRGASLRSLRELLALQSSDWAFLISNGTAGPYPLERFEGHLAALESEKAPQLRNLCPTLG